MSNLIFIPHPISPVSTPKSVAKNTHRVLINRRLPSRVSVKAFFFNPSDERILKEAIKEPVAFMGGMFAGFLKLNLNEEPLKEWINRTVEASGITEEEIEAQGANSEEEEAPQQIDIE
ncbi:UPF0426 protein At1g28150, chloroplastic [Amaranthus tricolor]|uniref:UPF0426 protein At1g28150, chloroplastic n=1 Tax=Amaranthus tricolor TaxID=29722 RepID=UPI0025902524|nr:UPF0426 protein At1g28150, chloroplastic [Amaranthus tricolor]